MIIYPCILMYSGTIIGLRLSEIYGRRYKDEVSSVSFPDVDMIFAAVSWCWFLRLTLFNLLNWLCLNDFDEFWSTLSIRYILHETHPSTPFCPFHGHEATFFHHPLSNQVTIAKLGYSFTYWCLVRNGWEWGNGIIINSDYGSFPHSLLRISKFSTSRTWNKAPLKDCVIWHITFLSTDQTTKSSWWQKCKPSSRPGGTKKKDEMTITGNTW